MTTEERIATSQPSVAVGGNGRSASRLLSGGRVEDSVAAQVLAPPGTLGEVGARPPERREAEHSADLQAIVEAVGALAGQPPR